MGHFFDSKSGTCFWDTLWNSPKWMFVKLTHFTKCHMWDVKCFCRSLGLFSCLCWKVTAYKRIWHHFWHISIQAFFGSQWHACGTESLPIHYRVSQKKVGLADKLTNIAPEGWILFFGTPGRSASFPLTGPCSHKLGVGCVVFGPPIGKQERAL